MPEMEPSQLNLKRSGMSTKRYWTTLELLRRPNGLTCVGIMASNCIMCAHAYSKASLKLMIARVAEARFFGLGGFCNRLPPF